MVKKVTLKDVATHAGVSKSTACDVLRGRKGIYKISDATRKRIHDAVKTLGYQPTNAARALSTGRTYHLGFLLSTRATLGLANEYYATVMAGVQNMCQQRGYQLSVSTYDLSNIKNFVMPPKLKQRSVDGVVIVGRVQIEVIELLKKEGIPFVMHGQSTNCSLADILTVDTDVVANWEQIISYLLGLGHKHIHIGALSGEYALEPLNKAVNKVKNNDSGIKFTVTADVLKFDDRDEFERGYDYAQRWVSETHTRRPSAVVLNDQWVLGFLKGLSKAGLSCPEDVSIFSTNNNPLIALTTPSISALDQDLFHMGQEASDILIDLIEGNIDRKDARKRTKSSCQPGKIIIRESTTSPT